MFSGHNYIGYAASARNHENIRVFSTVKQEYLPEEFAIASLDEIEEAALKAKDAFDTYKKTSFEERATFLEAIGEEIMGLGDALIHRAMVETGLTEARLSGLKSQNGKSTETFCKLESFNASGKNCSGQS